MDLTHKPTGIRIFCTQERSQIRNRELAMQLLRARLYELEVVCSAHLEIVALAAYVAQNIAVCVFQAKQQSSVAGERRAQIGEAKRSEKIRTYNWKDNRCVYPTRMPCDRSIQRIVFGTCMPQMHRPSPWIKVSAAERDGRTTNPHHRRVYRKTSARASWTTEPATVVNLRATNRFITFSLTTLSGKQM